MRMPRRDQRARLAVVAVLLLATAWIAVGTQSTTIGSEVVSVGHAERDANGVLSTADLTDTVVAPLLGTSRTAEPRPAPLGALPGLAAGLATLCLLRRQRLRPNRPARRVLLRGSVANRAPPLESFA